VVASKLVFDLGTGSWRAVLRMLDVLLLLVWVVTSLHQLWHGLLLCEGADPDDAIWLTIFRLAPLLFDLNRGKLGISAAARLLVEFLA